MSWPGEVKLPTVFRLGGFAVLLLLSLACLASGTAADFDAELDEGFMPFTSGKAHLRQQKKSQEKRSASKLFEVEETEEALPRATIIEESSNLRHRRQAIGGGGATSNTFNDVEASGTEEPEGSGTVPTAASLAYYRIGLLVTNVRYTLAHGDRSSAAFKELALEISTRVEKIYEEIPGEQFVTVLQFEPREDGYTEALFDLGSEVVFSEYALRTALESKIRGGMLGQLQVAPELLEFTPVIVPFTTSQPPAVDTLPPSLPPQPTFCRGDSDFRCSSGECVAQSLRCSGTYDCRDGSDEQSCLSQAPCRSTERYCDDGLCFNGRLLCDGIPHCRDESDEKPSVCGCPFRVGGTTILGRDEGIATWTEPSATDDSDEPMRMGQSHRPNTLFRVGKTTVEYYFTDASGNQANCTFIVSIVTEEDRIPPVVTGCRFRVQGTVETGQTRGTATWIEPTGSDDDGRPVRVRQTHRPSSSLFPVGPTTVQYSFTDSSGNRANCIFVVNMAQEVDRTPPVITGCPRRIFGFASPGENDGVATWDEPTATDNDGQVVEVARTHAPFTIFTLGPTRVAYHFTDTSGNRATCEFVVEIRQEVDRTPPVITGCPQRIFGFASPGENEGVAMWDEPTATDNDGRVVQVARTHAPLTVFALGPTRVAYHFTDTSGNRATCEFVVEIRQEEDRTPPVISGCLQSVFSSAAIGESEGVATWDEPTATDDDGRVVQVARTHAPSTVFALGPTRVAYHFTDTSGNRATCEFVVVIRPEVDRTPPVVTGCPQRVFGSASPGENEGVATWDEPAATDNDGREVQVVRTHAPLAVFTLGPTRVVYYFTDTSGNRATCEFVVEIRQERDDTPPVVTGCPEDIFQALGPGEGSAAVWWDEPTATDNDEKPVGVSQTHKPNASFRLGSNKVKYRFTDSSGNAASCLFFVIITRAVVPPTPAAPTTAAMETRPQLCGADEATCFNGQCIPNDYRCDGALDCDDGSDERDCPSSGCEPNEYRCASGFCIQKIWVCDGDDDCEDGSEERNCPVPLPGAPCASTEFQCLNTVNTQCIPKAYQCDSDFDCDDRSDEIGCTQPQVTQSPITPVTVTVGATVMITCIALGNPVPIISWRYNWGQLPDLSKVVVISENGRGMLTIYNVQESDQGAYTCEAMNNMGYVFAIPDAIVIVIPPEGICTGSVFNRGAQVPDDCIDCFCFDATNRCTGSSYFRSQTSLTFSNNDARGTLIGARSRADGSVTTVDESFIQVNPSTEEVTVQDLNRRLTAGDYYWVLPDALLGNKLTSYGGNLQYRIRFNAEAGGQPIVADITPDVVLEGNGIRLTYVVGRTMEESRFNDISVQLIKDGWMREEGDQKTRATRNEMMIVLQNIDTFIIRASYNTNMRDTSLSNVVLDEAQPENNGGEEAFLVEKCECPPGYTGQSCEYCLSGYYRVRNNRYLGTCVPCECNDYSYQCDVETGTCLNCRANTAGERCDQCAEGYYGDPLSSIPCMPCPCPLTVDPNQFSPTCYLDSDNLVTCSACPLGYDGRQCETCAPQYQGEPETLGSSCVPDGKACNADGTVQLIGPDCACKDNVYGEECNRCQDYSFYLNSDTPDGCISCFCMGVTRDCASTTYYRSQVSAVFTQNTQGFILSDSQGTTVIEQGLSANPASRELSFSNFRAFGSQTFYWSLPSSFTGDKVSSYGGNLRYTVNFQHGAGAIFTTEPDILLIGNGITAKIVHPERPSSNSYKTYSVPLIETYWRRLDEQPITREFLMMLLADVDLILIRATYSTPTTYAVLKDVTLDIAEPRNTGRERAYPVEQCICPIGYTGLSCEDCQVGYTRTGGGLYLGVCGLCQCNGHATDCDPETGACRSCQDNTYGDHCDQCLPGYYGNPLTGNRDDCKPCPCPLEFSPNQFSPTCYLSNDGYATCDNCPEGYTGRNCERCEPPYTGNPASPGGSCQKQDGCQCDPRGSTSSGCDGFGQCSCKDFAEGPLCNVCNYGYYNLATDNDDGCTKCFCMGVVDTCSSTNYYRKQLRVRFQSPTDPRSMVIRNRAGDALFSSGFTINVPTNEIIFRDFDQLTPQAYFWSLPPKFRGDQVTAYGGFLRYTISFESAVDGQQYGESDVEIFGNNIRLIYYDRVLQSGETRTNTIQLVEGNFRRPDQAPATREFFLMALADVEYILIRATFHSQMLITRIRDISMDIAVPENTGQPLAMAVEDCQCPPGYTGLSCEDCAVGYSRVDQGLYLGICASCHCNGHASTCNPENGVCIDCLHNTIGENCETCAVGYYGDATSGTPGDCRPCACPLSVPSNQFSPTCFLDSDGRPTCDACRTGYTGRDCGQCAAGFQGNPGITGGSCSPLGQEESEPIITISPSEVSGILTSTIYIRVYIQNTITSGFWIRADGRPLPTNAIQLGDYTLQIINLQSSDGGIYIFEARNQYGIRRVQVTITVIGPSMRVIIEQPVDLEVEAGSTVEFICRGISQVAYTLAWGRQSGSLPPNAKDVMGRLTIPLVTEEDQGIYICTGSNMHDVDQANARLTVISSFRPPTVRISPRFIQAEEGDAIEFTCEADGNPPPTLEWRGGSGGVLNPLATFVDGVFRIESVEMADEAEYFCDASNSEGSSSYRTVLYVTASKLPKVNIDTLEQQELTEGVRLVLFCAASGDPPPVVTWTRSGGLPLHPQSRQESGYLIIPYVRYEDQGIYICTAVNPLGSGYTEIDIRVNQDNRIPPTARIEPKGAVINQGTTQVLRCIVTGVPNPTITWSRNGGPLRSNHIVSNNMLQIRDASDIDNDYYTCRAENSAGWSEFSVEIIVRLLQPPRLRIFPYTDAIVSQGDSIQFQCQASGLPQPNVFWSRVGNQGFTGQTYANDNEGTLLIIGATPDEQGAYICTANNTAGTIQQTATLTVHGPPRVTISPASPAEFRIGDTMVLECVASGEPMPSVQWMKMGQQSLYEPVPVSELFDQSAVNDGSIVYMIDAVSMRDSGSYMCRAENAVGFHEREIIVDVVEEEMPGPPRIEVSVEELQRVEGESARFSCRAANLVDGSYDITWRRVDGMMPSMVTVDNGVLIFPETRAEYGGQYFCIITTGFGVFQRVVTLIVLVTPRPTVSPASQTVRAGDLIRIQCMAEGTLPMTYEWQKFGGPLPPTASDAHGMLQITMATAADAGEYVCTAINSAGSRSMSATVYVQVPPTVTVQPARETRAIGGSVEFMCHATGSPPPVIIWEKEGGFLPVQHSIQSGLLSIKNLQPGDEGRYVCTAESTAGSSKSFTRLALQAAPSVQISIHTTVQFIAIGESVTFECHARGDPEPVIQWSRENGELPITVIIAGGMMTIPQVQLQDAGTYLCTATNVVGSQTSKVILYVQAKPQVLVIPQERNAPVGTQVEFTCLASGFPPPETTWYKQTNDMPNRYSINNGKLTILSVTEKDEGVYICSSTNERGTSEYPVTLTVGELVPYFTQMPVSYISFPPLQRSYMEFDLTISFKPESSQGLILYNAQTMQGNGGDYIAFGMRNNLAEFQFELGSGPATLTSQQPLVLGQWHVVRLYRNKRFGLMQVDSQPEVTGNSSGAFLGLNLIQKLYLGGVRDFDMIPDAVRFENGFIGCISQFIINGQKIYLASELGSRVGINPCPTCDINPCNNGGVCQEASTEFGFQCLCQAGFTGMQCDAVVRCVDGLCGLGYCEEDPGAVGYQCICLPGHSGQHCEIVNDDSDINLGSGQHGAQADHGAPVYEPAFTGNSYITYPGLQSSLRQVQMAIMFKPQTTEDGILLFNGQNHRGTGDYIALVIRRGRLVFQYNSGTGPAIIESAKNLTAGQWYSVMVERNSKEGSLVIDGGEAVKGRSPGSSRGLNLKMKMFVGGLDEMYLTPKELEVSQGFQGCIAEIEIDGSSLGLISDAKENINVEECGKEELCFRNQCKNGATCTSTLDEYVCTCTADFTGRHCDTEIGPCHVDQPCENGGSCDPMGGDEYRCLCPQGFVGDHCEMAETFDYSASFTGNSYLKLPRNIILRERGSSTSKETINFVFSTLTSNGILLWQGVNEGQNGKMQDFISLGLINGTLEFGYQLGSGEASIRSKVKVNDGLRHNVTAHRRGREGALIVDGEEVSGHSAGFLQMLNVRGHLYLGGAPDALQLTGKKFSGGFEGCLTDLWITKESYVQAMHINLWDTLVDSVNVLNCPN